MLFSKIVLLTALGFGSAASAVPLVERQTTTPFVVIDTIIQSLNLTLLTSENAILTAALQVRGDINASVIIEIEAIIQANLVAIASALGNATLAVVAAAADGISAIVASVGSLTQADIDELTADITIVENIVAGLSATLIITITNLTPAINTAVAAEFKAVEGLLAPFANPLLVLAGAIANATVGVQLTVTGLANASLGLGVIITNLVASQGL